MDEDAALQKLTGVYPLGLRWQAKIHAKKAQKLLGTFDTATKAAEEYDRAALARDGWCGHLLSAACATQGCQANRLSRLGRCAGHVTSSTTTGSDTGRGMRRRGRMMRWCMGSASAPPAAGRRVRSLHPAGLPCFRGRRTEQAPPVRPQARRRTRMRRRSSSASTRNAGAGKPESSRIERKRVWAPSA